MVWQNALLSLATALPFIACASILILNKKGAAINFIMGVLTFVSLVPFYGAVLEKAKVGLKLFSITPDISFSLSLEPLGYLFALMVTSLWPITALYSVFYMSKEDKKLRRFYALLALAIGCTLGLAFSANLLTLFFFYEALTLSTYMLVAHNEDAGSLRAGRYYLLTLMAASLLMFLPAIVITYLKAGTVEFIPGGIFTHLSKTWGIVLLLLYVFGVAKIALMPMHAWLKRAMVAPTPVSALLHAVAVVKAGAFTLLKISIYIFGLDMLHTLATPLWLAPIACLTMLTASVLALEEDAIKARLAYSTIGQLSYIVLGLALATPTSIIGGIIHMLAHSFSKMSLFMASGSITQLTHIKRVSHMKGLGLYFPGIFFSSLIASLSIVGMPFFGSFWGKWFLLSSAINGEHFGVMAILLLATILSAAYLLPIPLGAFFESDNNGHHLKEYAKAPLLSFVPPLLTALVAIALFFLISPLLNLLDALSLEGA